MGSGKESKGSGAAPGGKSGGVPFAVGDSVVTRADPVSGKGDPTQESGVIVDDFGGALVEDEADYGRDWALAKRWAIKLDDGRLVFRSSDEVSRPKG
ncbi:hypothetical protein ACFWPA_18430 [Rhodococcus sp. NPDC058505]|uniref:hypothetical protein n=1 Tax=unclassified Rhodococcus (in: high G+C Gram-positive bacteria) TaxID=192944 RepID=UPI00364EA4C6